MKLFRTVHLIFCGWAGLVLATAPLPVAAQVSCPVFDQALLAALRSTCNNVAIGVLCHYPDENLSLNTLSDPRSIGSAAPLIQINAAAFTGVDYQTVPTTLLLVGDGTLSDETDGVSPLLLPVTTATGVNVRRRPQPDAAIRFGVPQGQALHVLGRLDDSSWLQVISGDGRGGWVTADAFSVPLTALPVIVPAAALPVEAAYLPYTHVALQPSVTLCAGNVPTGLLVQTHAETSPARLQVNGTTVLLDGTVFVSVQVQNEAILTTFALLRGRVTLVQADTRLAMRVGTTLTTRAEDTTITFTRLLSQPYPYEEYTRLPVSLLPLPFYVPVPDLTRYLEPRPTEDVSPLAGMLATDPCRITTGEGGSNLRAGAGTDYPVMGVMDFRESADVVGRAVGHDGQNWWTIAPYLWVSAQTTVTGGDCFSVPEALIEPLRQRP